MYYVQVSTFTRNRIIFSWRRCSFLNRTKQRYPPPILYYRIAAVVVIMISYPKIVRLSKKIMRRTHELSSEDWIVVQEKLDGANASFRLNADREVEMFSRNRKLDEKQHLRGFYKYVTESINRSAMDSNKVYFGEWLVPHTVQYDKVHLNKFYLFDILDTRDDTFSTSGNELEEAAKALRCCSVAVLYEGPFIGADHLDLLVGKSGFCGQAGEGIVVKCGRWRWKLTTPERANMKREMRTTLDPEEDGNEDHSPDGV